MADEFDRWMTAQFTPGEPHDPRLETGNRVNVATFLYPVGLTAEQARRLALHLLHLAGNEGEGLLSEEQLAAIRSRSKAISANEPIDDVSKVVLCAISDRNRLLAHITALTAALADRDAILADLTSPQNPSGPAGSAAYQKGVEDGENQERAKHVLQLPGEDVSPLDAGKRFRQLEHEEDRRHRERVEVLRKARQELQRRCPHDKTTYMPDASGNSGSWTECDICGATV